MNLDNEQLLLLKEQKESMSVSLASEVADKIKGMSVFSLSMDDINLYCSLFEDGRMSIPQNREAGDILLKPLLGDNFGFMRDRCVAAYITSVCADKEALSRLEDVIKTTFSPEKYLSYIANLKEKSILETRKGYLENEDIRFITTNIIDIDGTLDYGRDSSGKHKFNQHIIDMIVEHPDDDFAICTRRIFESTDRIETCATLIKVCQEILEDEPENKGIEKFMRLLQIGKLKAYSKSDLMKNSQICLAGSITDDEMPQILDIQSLSDASVSTYHSRAVLDDALQPLWEAVPAERKITLQQFEDEKMLLTRMEYLQNPEIKLITTEIIDHDALFTPSGQLDTDKIKVLMNKKEDWVIACFRRDKITQKLDENPDNEILCEFKELLARENKIIDARDLKRKLMEEEDDFCFVKPIVTPSAIYVMMKGLTDISVSLLTDPVPMDPRLQKVYEEVPAERKVTIKQYLGIRQNTAEMEGNSTIQEAIDRVQTQKQALVGRKTQTEDAESGVVEPGKSVKQSLQQPFDVKDIKSIKDELLK